MFGKIYDIISNKGIVIFVFLPFYFTWHYFFTFSKKWKWSTTQRKWGAETSTAASFDSTGGLRQPVRSTWQGPRKNEREAKKDGRLCSGAGTTGLYNCLLNLTIFQKFADQFWCLQLSYLSWHVKISMKWLCIALSESVMRWKWGLSFLMLNSFISTDLGFAVPAECIAKGQTTPVSRGRIPQEGNHKVHGGRLGEILFFQ